MSKYSENMPPDLKTAIGWMYDFIEPNKTFLDFGCATGYFGKLVKKGKNCKVYGVEISAVDVKEARKVLDGVYSFDLDGAEWPKEVYERQYDYLFYGDVLEHLKQPDEALKKSRALLKPGGKIFVSIPNIAHVSTRLELLQGNFEYESMGILDNTHLKYFTLEAFSRLANEAGYNIEAVDYTINDFPTAVIKKILKKVGLKPDETFWGLMETVEARASQLKFVLAPTDKKTIQNVLPIKPLPTKPEQQRDSYVDDLRRQKEALHEHANKQAELIEFHVNRAKQLEEENAQLKQRFTHKISNAIQRIQKRG